MPGKNDHKDKEMPFIHFLVWLPALLFLVSAAGCCMPTVGIYAWPVPGSVESYLPPSERGDVLLLCLYDNSYENHMIVDDVQILSYPYDSIHYSRMTGFVGLMSMTWKYGIERRRHSILLFTGKRQIIYVPLRPYRASDDALSYFYVMNNPPLKKEDFCCCKDDDSSVLFNCVSLADYYPREITAPDTKFLWRSLEDAKLAKKFWEDSSASPARFQVPSTWKLHSIFGRNGLVLTSRKVKPPAESSDAKTTHDANNHPVAK